MKVCIVHNLKRELQSSAVQCNLKVTLRLTVSQSVCLGVEPNLGLLTRDFFLKLLSCHFLGAPFLTRGQVCHVPVFVFEVYSSQSLSSKYLHLNYKLTKC
jgi:hypothetical protein